MLNKQITSNAKHVYFSFTRMDSNFQHSAWTFLGLHSLWLKSTYFATFLGFAAPGALCLPCSPHYAPASIQHKIHKQLNISSQIAMLSKCRCRSCFLLIVVALLLSCRGRGDKIKNNGKFARFKSTRKLLYLPLYTHFCVLIMVGLLFKSVSKPYAIQSTRLNPSVCPSGAASILDQGFFVLTICW